MCLLIKRKVYHLSWPPASTVTAANLHRQSAQLSWKTCWFLCCVKCSLPISVLSSVHLLCVLRATCAYTKFIKFFLKHWHLSLFALRLFNVSNVACLQELAQSRRNVTQLTTVVEQLHKEKANLMEEVEAHEFTVRSSVVATKARLPFSCNEKGLCVLKI